MMFELRQIVLPATLALGVAAFAPAAAQDAQSAPGPVAEAPPAEEPPAEAPPAETPAAEASPAETPPAAAAPAEAETAAAPASRIAPPPAGKGQVVFFRPSNMMGMALSFSVHEGEKGIGKLGNGTYFVHVADPGTHLFTIQSEVTDKLTLEIDEGETYYVKQTVGVGIVAGRPRLTPAEQGEFERLKLKPTKKKATDLKPKAGKAD